MTGLSRWKAWRWAAAVALAITVAGIWVFLRFFPRDAALPPPSIVPLTSYAGREIRPSLSADGSWVAFQWKGEKQDNWDIYVKEVDGTGFNQLTSDPASDCCAAWSPDGRRIAFLRGPGDRGMLYLISPLGGIERKLTEIDRGRLGWSPDGKNIAFMDKKSPMDPWSIWSLSVETLEKQQMTTPDVSCHGDMDPAFSPDGRRVAFASDSSGSGEIWVCDADGKEPMKLTDMKSESIGSPSWSPDGRRIAFDSTKSDNLDIYVVSAETGPVKRFTTDPTEEAVPRWSRDGRWIYFGSNRSGSWMIWKMRSDGGKAVQVTRNGGLSSRESADGHLYYHDYWDQKKGLWRIPLSGGPETLVLDREIDPANWDLTDRGIYFIEHNTVFLYDFAARREISLAPVNSDPRFVTDYGLSVSPDGKWLLYAGGFHTSDIMMIDNFR